MFSINVQQETLVLNAGSWRRHLCFTPHGVRTTRIEAGEAVLALAPMNEEAECAYDGLTRHWYERQTTVPVPIILESLEQKEEFSLRARWRDEHQGLRLSREWQLWPGVEAWHTRASVQSEAAPQVDFGGADYFNVVETLPLDLSGWCARVVRFYGNTDYHNEPIAEEEFSIEADYSHRDLRGNLLFLESPSGTGIFLLNEAPPENEKRVECACDFQVGPDGVRVLGWGVAPHEVLPDRERFSYGVGIGRYEGGATGATEALRRYVKVRYPSLKPERAIVANPWGDRRCYTTLGEAFVLQELEACAELGITHYQIDDGWQAGGVLPDLCLDNWARVRSFWDIHPEKFPRGFAPLAQRARELGVQLSLWFAPDANRHYRNWREECEILLDMHRRYGINLFKIDAVWLRSKEAEENFTSLLRETQRASNDRIRFNLDVTAGRRPGYFADLEFGSLFIENRYMQGWSEASNSYRPHRVLRNFWLLAHYVPPEKMQFEIPNIAGPAVHPGEATDPTSAVHHAWDYLAAIALFSSPLVWCEPSGLPEMGRRSLKKVLELHHQLRDDIREGHTFPIGEEPDGSAWTGFQSCRIEEPRTGLLLVFREMNDRDFHLFILRKIGPQTRLKLSCLSHNQPDLYVATDSESLLRLNIPRQRDFRLFRYEVEV